jgi:phytoene dehydrogenase-like protein
VGVVMMALLDFSNLKMRYAPFPIGVARPVMDEATYRQFIDAFPPVELFDDYAYLGKVGKKLTLSEKDNYATYQRFVAQQPWNGFYRWIKDPAFPYYIMDVLKEASIDLGFKNVSSWARVKKVLRNRSLDYFVRNPVLRSRFEFSILRGDGGNLPPHTDAPSKAVTIIVSMAHEGEWHDAWGGGTTVCQPKDERLNFNKMNKPADFSDMDVIETYPFVPNQAIVFVKTHNSWHGVEPIVANDPSVLRRTLTINIEMF